jgi:cobalt/nickel transport system permease protein
MLTGSKDMHLPDGFLDPKLSGGLLGAAAAVVTYCAVQVMRAVTALVPQGALATLGRAVGNLRLQGGRVITQVGDAQLRRMGVVAAWVLAAQMFNFPIASGTSGHLLGGVFAAVLLGPFAGTLVITAVLLVQALLFADGGILALGANIINIAMLGSWAGYYLYKGLTRMLPEIVSIAIASWLSVVLAAIACALEIGCSGFIRLAEVTPSMLRVHLVIGAAEAVITVLLLSIFRTNNAA